jgi:hypothetical protein
VAVVISTLQLLSAVGSLQSSGSVSTVTSNDPFKGHSSVDRAASTFFLVMTAGMIVAIISHIYLTRMPIYKEASIEFEGKPAVNEETPLLYGNQARNTARASRESSPAHRILRVSWAAKIAVGLSLNHRQISLTNWTYNLAIFLVFFVTLVRRKSCYSRQFPLTQPFHRPSFPPSRQPSSPLDLHIPPPSPIPSSSMRFTSCFSILETG